MSGWSEGMWWSIVSMTTVGYGDKCPRSPPARLFSVIWILIGIIMFGVLSGSITTSIMDINSPPPPDMANKKVGALKLRHYEAYAIAKHGGSVTYSNGEDFASQCFGLNKMLKDGEIDGILFNKETIRFLYDYLTVVGTDKNDASQMEIASFFTNNTLRTEKKIESGEKFTYGILVKSKEDFEYFRGVVRDNYYSAQTYVTAAWNKKKEQIASEQKFYSVGNRLFNPHGYYFRTASITTAALIGGIFVFGVVYEIKNRKRQSDVSSPTA